MHDRFLAACRSVVGDSNVLVRPEDVVRFEQDVWQQYRGRAAAVVRPATTGEVAAIVSAAAADGIALVPQAGNTGLVNGGIPDPTGREVVLSLERLDRIRAVDPVGDYLIADAGCILDHIHHAADEAGRMFPLALGASGSCRIGGNLATNAGGLNVLRYGMARDLVLGLEVVLADGTVLDLLRPLRKDNTGYDLKRLFIGSEGTLGVITAASLRLFSKPRERVTLWLGVNSADDAVAVFKMLRDRFGELLSAFELMSADCVDNAVGGLSGVRSPLSGAHPWHLLIEVAWSLNEGLQERVEAELEAIASAGLCRDGTIATSEAQRANMWRLREGQSEAARRHGYILRSDVAVAISRLPDLLHWVEGERGRLAAKGIRVLPFGHVGDGNVHVNYVLPPGSDPAHHHGLLDALFDEIHRLDGSISAEHGIGRAKREAVAARKPAPVLETEMRLKRVFDPANILNPGVVFPESEMRP